MRAITMKPRAYRLMLDIGVIRAVEYITFVCEEAAPPDVIAGQEIPHHLATFVHDFLNRLARKQYALRPVEARRIDYMEAVAIAGCVEGKESGFWSQIGIHCLVREMRGKHDVVLKKQNVVVLYRIPKRPIQR